MQNLIAAVAHNGNRDYRMMMLELWGFRYEKSNQNFGERLGLSWSGNLDYRRKLLLDFHGISMEWKYKISDIQDLGSYVENNPVAFYTDSYDCEWLPFYHKQHRSHLCNIVSVEDNICYCQDEYLLGSDFVEFNKQSIMENQVLVFEYKAQPSIYAKDIKEEVYNRIMEYERDDTINHIVQFAEDFVNEFNIMREVTEGEDIIASKLIMYLKNLGDDRSNLCQFFEFCNNYMSFDCSSIKNILLELSKQYYLIRNNIVKVYFSKNFYDKKHVANSMKIICKLEEQVYYTINKLFG